MSLLILAVTVVKQYSHLPRSVFKLKAKSRFYFKHNLSIKANISWNCSIFGDNFVFIKQFKVYRYQMFNVYIYNASFGTDLCQIEMD